MTPEEALDVLVEIAELHTASATRALDVLRELISAAQPFVQCPNCGHVARTSVWDVRGRPEIPS